MPLDRRRVALSPALSLEEKKWIAASPAGNGEKGWWVAAGDCAASWPLAAAPLEGIELLVRRGKRGREASGRPFRLAPATKSLKNDWWIAASTYGKASYASNSSSRFRAERTWDNPVRMTPTYAFSFFGDDAMRL